MNNPHTPFPSAMAAAAMALIASVALFSDSPAANEERRLYDADFLFPRSTSGAIPPSLTVAPEIAPPLETPIDPRTYRVIPGDLFQLEVGGETDRAWRLAITTEGKLLLPGADAIDATDATIEELAARTRAALAARFPRQSISLHLLQPGAFRAAVTGQVANPGIQILRSYDRISVAISAAGGPLPGASLRGIEMRRPDGRTDSVDLVRFAALGDLGANPFLTPGVSIHVPAARDYVHVAGAVRGVPGGDRTIVPNVGSRIPELPDILLEWREGDTIESALARAGGLSQDASGEIILLRDGDRRAVDLAASGSEPLRAGDAIEAAVADRWVFVTGAVRYPGPYPHLPTMTASDYVRLAGGPTEIGRGSGWRLRRVGQHESVKVGGETYVEQGSTINVPEKWTYRTSQLLAPISGVTALVISVIALRK